MKTPKWHRDFEFIRDHTEDPVQYQSIIQQVWNELIGGPQSEVIITAGKLVFIGHLEKLEDGVRMRIDIGQLNFFWEDECKDGESLQQEIDFNEADRTGG